MKFFGIRGLWDKQETKQGFTEGSIDFQKEETHTNEWKSIPTNNLMGITHNFISQQVVAK